MAVNREKILSNLKEADLFQLLQKYWTDIVDNNLTNPNSIIDWYVPTTNTWIEGKCRPKHWDALLIERSKWNALMQKENAYYINSTPKGIFVFDIKQLEEPIWDYNKMAKSTYFEGSGTKIEKDSGYYPISKASFQLDQILIN
jgi:hypothetical protein